MIQIVLFTFCGKGGGHQAGKGFAKRETCDVKKDEERQERDTFPPRSMRKDRQKISVPVFPLMM